MRRFYCLWATLLLLGVLAVTAEAVTDSPSDPKAAPKIAASLAASLGKDIVAAAHPTAKKIALVEFKQSQNNGQLVAALKMEYHGKITGAKYTANIRITIDPAKPPHVVDVAYKDDNRIRANKKNLEAVRQGIEQKFKSAWDAKPIARAKKSDSSPSAGKTLKKVDSSPPAGNRPELVLQTGHSSAIISVSFSPDGKRLASASEESTVVLWDTATGHQLRTFKGHAGMIRSVSFSPDGKRLASASLDKVVILWDTAKGTKLRTLKGHAGPVVSVSFSPDGKRLATASSDKTLVLWDAATGVKLRTLTGHSEKVLSVSFSPDGKRLASAGGKLFAPGEVKVWDADTGAEVRTLQGHSSKVNSVSFSPDGKRLATASSDKTVVLWDADTGAKLRTLQGHSKTVNSVSFSPDGKCLATASYDNRAIVWDATSGDKLRTLIGHTDCVTSVSFSPDGQRLATASRDKTAVVWDATTGDKQLTLKGHIIAVESLSFSPDGKRLASASGDRTITLWDAATGAKLRTLNGDSALSFSPDGKRLASALFALLEDDATTVVWDATTGDKLLTLKGHNDEVNSVSFSPDGRRLATAGGGLFAEGGEVVVWDAATGDKLRALKEHTRAVDSVSFSPDGKRLASASWDETVVLWDVDTGVKLRTLKGHEGGVNSVSFSPDGKRLASASSDGTVVLWDAATGAKLRTLQGHTHWVTSVLFSPDGQRLATASRDGTVALWEASTGDELLRLIALDAGRDWLVVTPEGLFDGSKAGMQKVAFRIGKGLDVRQVDDFFNDFYYPGLLAAIFKGERPRPAAKIALPPNVKFVTPAHSVTVESPTQTVEVEASDAGGGVKSIALFVNGVRLQPAEAAQQPNPKTIRQPFTVCLVPGDNRLEARAAGEPGAGEGKAEPIVLKYLRPLDRPNLYVLAIGVGNYQQAGLKLEYPVNDANSFAELFQKRGGALFAKVALTKLLDANVTAARIEAAFKAIDQTAHAQDVVIVTLAGHGKTLGQRYYFLPVDFKYDDPKTPEPSVRKYGIAADEMAIWTRSIKAHKKVWFIDTCNSGGAIKQLLRESLDRDPFAFRGAVERLNRSEGMFIIAAATKSEEAKERKELGHGLLSYSLLAAAGAVSNGPLKNEPAKPERDVNTLDIGTWLNYAENKMPALMKLYYGYEQQVKRGQDPSESFPLLSMKP